MTNSNKIAIIRTDWVMRLLTEGTLNFSQDTGVPATLSEIDAEKIITEMIYDIVYERSKWSETQCRSDDLLSEILPWYANGDKFDNAARFNFDSNAATQCYYDNIVDVVYENMKQQIELSVKIDEWGMWTVRRVNGKIMALIYMDDFRIHDWHRLRGEESKTSDPVVETDAINKLILSEEHKTSSYVRGAEKLFSITVDIRNKPYTPSHFENIQRALEAVERNSQQKLDTELNNYHNQAHAEGTTEYERGPRRDERIKSGHRPTYRKGTHRF